MQSAKVITRKDLVSSLLVGLLIGLVAGSPIGWLAHRFYAEQRMAQVLVCRERYRNQPEAFVQARCGTGL